MPRRTDRKQINPTVSEAQHAAAVTLAGSEGLNNYIRRLISEDAARRGIAWPADLPGPGKYPRLTGPRYQIAIYPGHYAGRVKREAIQREFAAESLAVALDQDTDSIWVSPDDVSAAVEILNRLGYVTDEDDSDPDSAANEL